MFLSLFPPMSFFFLYSVHPSLSSYLCITLISRFIFRPLFNNFNPADEGKNALTLYTQKNKTKTAPTHHHKTCRVTPSEVFQMETSKAKSSRQTKVTAVTPSLPLLLPGGFTVYVATSLCRYLPQLTLGKRWEHSVLAPKHEHKI